MEHANDVAHRKDDLLVQMTEKKELAERDLKAIQHERNELFEQIKEYKVEYEYDLKRARN